MQSANNTLVFDLGSTLYPSSLQLVAMDKTLELHGIQHANYEDYYTRENSNYSFLGGTLNVYFICEFLNSLQGKPQVDAYTLLGDYRQNLFNLIVDHVRNDPHGTWKFLKEISKTHTVGILSDNSIHTREMWQEILKNNDMDVFDFFVVSEEIGVSKPHLKMFFEIKRLAASNFDEITFFGDNLIRDGASAFHGMQFVHVHGFSRRFNQKKNPYLPSQPMISIEFVNYTNIDPLMVTNKIHTSNQKSIINVTTIQRSTRVN